MKVLLVFDDWRRHGQSIYQTEEGMRHSMSDFHSGTTFEADLTLDAEQEAELRKALATNACPVFWLSQEVELRKAKALAADAPPVFWLTA